MKELKVRIYDQGEVSGTYYGECEEPTQTWLKPIAHGKGSWVSHTGKWAYEGKFSNNRFHNRG